MKKLNGKIKDMEPNSAEVDRGYRWAIFWSAFALLVGVLGNCVQLWCEVSLVPLLLGLAATGLVLALIRIEEGGGE